jgi:hypothetical protein
MRVEKSALILGFILLLQIPLAKAGLIVLEPVDSGEIFAETDGLVIPPYNITDIYAHGEGLDRLTAMYYDSFGCLCFHEEGTSGYVIYDLSSVGAAVESVSMQLNLTLTGSPQGDLMHILAIDGITAEVLSLLPAGPLGSALGESLFYGVGEGPSLGFQEIDTGSGVYTIELSVGAVDLVNKTGGLLAFGFRNPGTSGYEAELSFNNAPRLLLTSEVSSPGTQWLLTVGLALFLRRQWREAN